MEQNFEIDAVKKKIRALLEKKPESGATEGECMLAMKKVGELLLQYNLSMDEVYLSQQVCVTKTFDSKSLHRDVIWLVASGLAKFLGVKHWYSRSHKGIVWTFFGLEHDVDMALYLCDFIQKAEATALTEFKSTATYIEFTGHRKIATTNFRNGFGTNISARLYDMASEAEAAERKAHEFHAQQAKGRMIEASEENLAAYARQTTGTALMVVAKAKRIEEEFKKSGPKLRFTRHTSSARYHSGSYGAGTKAGDKINLGRPVEGGSGSGIKRLR